MNDVTGQALLSVLRTLLAAGGAWMTTHDYLPAESMNELTGAVMIIIPIAWGVVQKYQAEHKAQAREAVAINVGIDVSNAEPQQTAPLPARAVPEVIKRFRQQ